MKNPCVQCLVNPMCRNTCYKLNSFLEAYLPHFPRSDEYEIVSVAVSLRKGIVELHNNKRGWKYTGKWKAYENKYHGGLNEKSM